MMTGHPGIFAGGDMVPAERTVTVGIGHGKKAARNIDAWLRGRRATRRRPSTSSRPSTRSTPGTTPTRRAPSGPQLDAGPPALDASTRSWQGLDESNALFEARRCLSCGNCFACDNCYGVCPDNAVIKLSEPRRDVNGYEIDLDYCKGCGICAAECPAARSRWSRRRSERYSRLPPRGRRVAGVVAFSPAAAYVGPRVAQRAKEAARGLWRHPPLRRRDRGAVPGINRGGSPRRWRPAGGAVSHAAGPTPDGWQIIAIFDSEADWVRFATRSCCRAGAGGGRLRGPPEERSFEVANLQTA